MYDNLKKLAGQLIIGGFRNNNIQKKSNIVKNIQKYNLAGVILYDEDVAIGGTGTRNIKSQPQVKKLIKDLKNYSNKQDLLITIDQEGGIVHRLKSVYGFPETPSWKHIGY